MSIKLELDADSIKQAISAHIAAQGFNLEGKHVDVALINGRGGNGNRATITITEQTANTAAVYHPEVEEVILPDVPVEETVKVESVEVIIPDLDPIMAAAENSSDPFGSDDEDAGLFPTTNPGDVETPQSLF